MTRFIVCYEALALERVEKFIEALEAVGAGSEGYRRLQGTSWIVAYQGGSAVALYNYLYPIIGEGSSATRGPSSWTASRQHPR